MGFLGGLHEEVVIDVVHGRRFLMWYGLHGMFDC